MHTLTLNVNHEHIFHALLGFHRKFHFFLQNVIGHFFFISNMLSLMSLFFILYLSKIMPKIPSSNFISSHRHNQQHTKLLHVTMWWQETGKKRMIFLGCWQTDMLSTEEKIRKIYWQMLMHRSFLALSPAMMAAPVRTKQFPKMKIEYISIMKIFSSSIHRFESEHTRWWNEISRVIMEKRRDENEKKNFGLAYEHT